MTGEEPQGKGEWKIQENEMNTHTQTHVYRGEMGNEILDVQYRSENTHILIWRREEVEMENK